MNLISKKRIIAYIIDIFFLVLILMLVYKMMPENNNIKLLNVKLDYLNEQFLNKDITFFTYINDYSKISYGMDKENLIYTVINICFTIIYFILIPYFFKGQTIGMKLLKIKLIKEDNNLNFKSLIIRNLIINGLLYMLISLLLIYLITNLAYFIIITILGVIQICVVITSLVGIIKNDENLILHDKIANTKVVNL